MAAVWGRAEIEVHADGDSLPGEIRRMALTAGDEAGKDASEAFGESFSKGVRKSMKDALDDFSSTFKSGAWKKVFIDGGRNLGGALSKGFADGTKTFRLEFDKVSTDVVRQSQEMARSMRDVDFGRWADDFGRFTQVFREIEGNQLALPAGTLEDWGELRQVFDETGTSAQNTSKDFNILWRELESGEQKTTRFGDTWGRLSDRMKNFKFPSFGGGGGGGLRGLIKGFKDAEGPMQKHSSLWKNLSHNTKQWTLIIGAVIGALPQLASLSSAAGSGLFVLGGALGLFVTGLAFAVVGFARFMGDIKKLPAAIKPARKAFDGFRDSFGKVMDAMTVSAFKGTEKAWKQLGKAVTALTPGFEAIGDVVNGLIRDLAKNISPRVIENMNSFLATSADVLDRVFRAVGLVGEALLDAFASDAFQHALDGFLTWIEELSTTFANFLKGPGFDEWIRHGEEVFGAFGGLLETTGGLLNDLVTDESIEQLTDFIGHIEGFLDGGGRDILEFAQELDIFGVIARALDEFGRALEPLAGPMKEFADAMNTLLNTAIDTLAPILTDIAEAMAPLVTAVTDFINANPQLVADVLIAIGGAVAVFKLAKWAGMVGKFTTFSKIKGLAGKASAILAIAGAIEVLTGVFDSDVDVDAGMSSITGALIGARFGGPIGALAGTVIGLVVSMIDDVFLSPETKGAWQKGWDQIFDPSDFSGAGIGPMKEWLAGLNEDLTTGWNESLGSWRETDWVPFWEGLGPTIETNFNEMISLLEEDWATISTGFDGWWAGIQEGWDTFWADTGTNLETAWTDIVTGFEGWWEDIETGWKDFWGGLWKWVEDAWTFVVTTLKTWWLRVQLGFSLWWLQVTLGWNNFWNDLKKKPGEIWSSITTTLSNAWTGLRLFFAVKYMEISLGWNLFWSSLPRAVENAAATIRGIIDGIRNNISNIMTNIGNLFNASSRVPTGGGGGGAAAGTILYGPRRLLAGEAGPEAIVPLRRPLGAVDPSVRGLSAIAQGMAMPAGGPSRVVNVSAGAVQVHETGNARATAYDVLDLLANRIAG